MVSLAGTIMKIACRIALLEVNQQTLFILDVSDD
jgi:hypothetical protein